MTKRPRSCGPAFGLLTAGLFLLAACHVVDTDDDDSHRRCRAAGDTVFLVAANAGDRPGARVDTGKRDQPPARPTSGDRVRKDPSPAPRVTPPRRAHEAPTPTPSPSRTDRCKGAR
ncbi:membrane protein [Streptomyces phage TurkishDelight]|uniref:Membrane protein n=1 Tax=Streptomyces phage TurkishDelight TaxID=2793708 RepID=A0A7T0M125_9CAUD|nr:membrane protein [Streptomyces phage TurkishDelight]QPL14098.1 membrane protein [Streptomyces phage TurkishDelight]